MLFGVIHYIFWDGDILLSYGIMMVPLILFRKMKDTGLLIIGVALALNIPGNLLHAYKLMHHVAPLVVQTTSSTSNPITDQLYSITTGKSLAAMVKFNLGFMRAIFQFQFWTGRLFIILGYFLLGIYVAHKKWLINILQHKKNLYLLALISFPALVTLQLLQTHLNYSDTSETISGKFIYNTFLFIEGVVAILLYISFVSILFLNKFTEKIAAGLASIGKIALSTYLMQTIIGMLLFYHIGFGLFPHTTPAQNLVIAVFVFVLQVGFSVIWNRYFNYGILEWLLRAGTLLEFKPLRKPKPQEQLLVQPVLLHDESPVAKSTARLPE